MAAEKRKRYRRPPPVPARGKPWLTTAEAAKLSRMTRGGILQAIARGALEKAKRNGRTWLVQRKELREWREFMNTPPPDPNRKLTDDEFLQQMIDNDPDDW